MAQTQRSLSDHGATLEPMTEAQQSVLPSGWTLGLLAASALLDRAGAGRALEQ